MASSESLKEKDFWHKNLDNLPRFTNSFIESFASKHLPIKATLTRGYKFFCESYIHDVEVKLTAPGKDTLVRAKCYRSMKKNEEPHKLLVNFDPGHQPSVSSFKCSCAAGQGLCHHIIGLMYTLAHYQMLGLKSVPPVISKTSKPQTWHIPNRVDGISARPVMDVTVQKIKAPSSKSAQPKKKRNISGVACTVYKPFEQPLHSLNLHQLLAQSFANHKIKPGFLRIWPDEDEDIPLCVSRFGVVPKGSVLSYQQPATSDLPNDPSICVPEFTFPVLPRPHIVLTEKQQAFYESLYVNTEQSLEYERLTREQSQTKDWHRLRKYRLTASGFKNICSRRKDFESLSARLLNAKLIQTAAMKYGILHEDEAAHLYAREFGRDVYKVGFAINPSVHHLGCSPDRRVYDPTEGSPWGLSEVKCSPAERLQNLQYLKLNEVSGKYHLKKVHAYYFQVMGCLGLTGSSWGDFFVFCRQEFHCERIYFDADFFSGMIDKLNLFYFNFHLPSSVE